MLEVKRKNNESFDSLLRRFSRRVQQSGVVNDVKAGLHRQPKFSERKIKERALYRQHMISRREYLRRIGKLEDLFE